jgi:hypothetical protein
VLPAAAAPVMNASAIGPSAQNAFSATVFGRAARRGTGRAGKGLAGLDEHQVHR